MSDCRATAPESCWSNRRAPLVAVRPMIPGSDIGILTRDMGMPTFTWLFRKFVVPLVVFRLGVALAVTFWALA